jgi:hypothetical protein
MDLFVLIFWFGFFTLIGVALGSFFENRINKRKGLRQPAPTSENSPATAEDMEILRAWRTRAGKLWLEMDGHRLDDKAALQPEQHRRLLNALVDLRPWLEGGSSESTAPRPAPMAVPAAQVSLPTARKDLPAGGKPQPAVSVLTIIQQINDVLQAKLAASPLKDRGIEIYEGVGGVVMVKDGINKYEGVDAVPDLQVQALIRQAVADWEKIAR